jgi:GTP diphosphokinase / guanosine-3',5'-bis(diphosphate) 3'-diphosphatase
MRAGDKELSLSDQLEDTGLSLVLHAAAFAAAKHRDQRRKDREASPYINHPISLACILAKEAGISDPIVLSAALLHDTIEDTDATIQELECEFGEVVASVVMEVTDDKSLPKHVRKRLQVEHAATISDRAKLVKLADKICNLRDMASSPPADWSIERRREYFDWAKEVIDGVRGINARLESLFDAAYKAKP